jgi:hypothetical protein
MSGTKSKSRRSSAKSKRTEKSSLLVRFTYSDSEEAFEIDVWDLTAEEQVAVERFFDKPWNHLLEEGWLLESIQGKVFLAYLARRRQEPDFTHAEALEFNPTTKEQEGGSRPTKGSKSAGSQS